MERSIITNERTGEQYTRIIHDSGLTILIWKVKDHSVKHALFGTKYGSVNTTFKTKNDDDFITVPNGIAHYLEHKLFENEDCDAFKLYAQTGASANAYTSFDKTCYLFTCTDNFLASLEILLKFVQEPYFTEETVRKEQGIIGQEIRMYDDNPGWKVMFNMLEGIYHKNPVKIDIAGTQESIALINADLLYRCYYTFYNLHNMVLSIAGDVDEDEILKVCDRLLKPSENMELETIVPEEPDTVAKKFVSRKMEVATPTFCLGFKSSPIGAEDIVAEDVKSDIALALLADESTDFYKELYDEGLINSSFGYETFSGEGFFVPMFEGDSREPEKTAERICRHIDECKKTGFDKAQFERIRKAYYGSLIRSLNDPEALATGLINSGMRGTGTAFSTIEAVASVTLEEVEEFLRQRINTDNCTLSVIYPTDKD
ncbi:MAG: EF-P 5-aminopentanol modification-associated protein YfmH [Huintestinicola sp.]